MKKIISVLLAVILAFSVLAVSVAAEGGTYQTYHVAYEIKDTHLQIVPLDGYDQYVLPGEDFKFIVKAEENYSDTFAIVEVDGVTVEPDVHGVYTIPEIEKDFTITVNLSTNTGASNMFSSLIILVHDIMAWLKNIIETLIKGTAT